MAETEDDMKTEWFIAAAKFGPGWVLAALLIYFMLADVRSSNAADHQEHTQMIIQGEASKQLAGRAVEVSEKILVVLRIQCANAARTDDARERCLRDQ